MYFAIQRITLISFRQLSCTQKPFITASALCEVGKNSNKTFLKIGMEMKKVQKQGRDERMHEDYPTWVKNKQQM